MTLRDDGVGYGDYLEQLTYLLFLKMAHEYAAPPYSRDLGIPKGHDWDSLRQRSGEPLEAQYLAVLHELGRRHGIFFKAQNKIQDPAKLHRLVQLIDEQNWVGLDADTKGDLYEGLLQKNAEDTKSGAGQYFTPWPLKLDDLKDFVQCYQPANRHDRRETERFRYFPYEQLIARDKASLDLFWLKDDSLERLDELPPPEVLQQEIIEHLEAALAAFRDVAAALPQSSVPAG